MNIKELGNKCGYKKGKKRLFSEDWLKSEIIFLILTHMLLLNELEKSDVYSKE